MPKPYDDVMYDKIIMLADNGLTCAAIGNILGVQPSTASRIQSVYFALRDGKPLTDAQRKLTVAIKYACQRLNLDPAEYLGKPEPKQEPPADPPQRDNTALAFAGFMDALKGLTDAIRAIDDRLTAMQMTMQGHRGEARVYTDKIVEAININGDIVSKEHRVLEDKLEAVKINTKSLRRRGNDRDSI